jgi:predicted negative regulator of RcsB-dependent stress response
VYIRRLPVATNTNIQSDKAEPPARDTAGSRLAAKPAAKAARKASQRGTTDPAEQVAKQVRNANAWFEDHGKSLAIGIGALVLIGGGWVLFATMQGRSDHAAGDALKVAVATMQGLIVTADETAPEEPLVPVFSSVKERDEKALKQFNDVVKQYPNTSAGHYAQLGAANAALELGQYAQAATAFGKVLDSAGDDTFLRFRALEGSGFALEGQQKYEEARKRFESLSQLQSGAYRTIGDYHQARMLVAQGQRDAARKLLEASSKAAADKPDEQGERFESIAGAAQTLLSELGGKPAEKAGKGSGISQNVLDALRKQLATQKK